MSDDPRKIHGFKWEYPELRRPKSPWPTVAFLAAAAMAGLIPALILHFR